MATVEHNSNFDLSPPGGEIPIVHRRPLSEGVFCNEETTPEHSLPAIRFVQPKPDEEYKPGTVKRELAFMDDGTVYPVLTGTPKHQRSDTAVVFTTAWLTSTKGHNMRTMLRMMQLGYPAILIGPEGEVTNRDLSFKSRAESAFRTTIFKTAADVSDITYSKLKDMDVRDNGVIGIGESRGAMVGMGIRGLVYGDFTAPCFKRAPTPRELIGVATQLGKEGVTLGKLAIQLFGPSLRHYPATLHKKPEYYLKELFKIPMLMSGQAGRLAVASNLEAPMHVRIFAGDGWSQAEEWRQLFAPRPHVHLETAEGNHLDIANPATLGNISVRLARLAEARGYDGLFTDIDYPNEIFETQGT